MSPSFGVSSENDLKISKECAAYPESSSQGGRECAQVCSEPRSPAGTNDTQDKRIIHKSASHRCELP